jgi:hypothetical protein
VQLEQAETALATARAGEVISTRVVIATALLIPAVVLVVTGTRMTENGERRTG